METIFFKLAIVFYVLSIITRNRSIPILGLIAHIIGILVYSLLLRRPPFINLSESIMFFSSFLVLFPLLFKLKGKEFTLILVVIALFYSLMFPSQGIPLMPALRSPWLYIHVPLCFLSYAFFSQAAILGIVFLLKNKDQLNISRLISLGFFFLTFGIITGSIWAFYAWGRYWAWDPKEVWALITWLYYAIFLHLKAIKVSKKKEAYLAIIGFLLIVFTFIGVNFLLPSLHSYL